MPLLVSGQVGPQTLADGVGTQPFRQGRTGDLIVQELHGKYYEIVARGSVFAAANQAATTFTLFGNTTATGLVLSNPLGSGKNLVILNLGYILVAAAAAAIGNLVISAGATNITAHTTPLTVQPCLIGSTAASVGKADSAATLPTAGTIIAGFATPSVSATATTSIPPVAAVDVAGQFIVIPGAFIQLASGITTAVANLIGHIIWEEVVA